MKNVISSRRFVVSRIVRRAVSGLAAGACLWAGTISATVLSWSGSSSTSSYWSDSANWGFVGTPSSGDVLIFSPGQPRMLNTNDIPGLTLNQLRFVGVGGVYDIRGNAFTLTNNIECTNSSATTTIETGITLAGTNQIFDVKSILVLSGLISGSAGFVLTGGGTLYLSGSADNPYTGPTFVSSGTLMLNNSSGHSINSSSLLYIGDGVGGVDSDVVRYSSANGNQILVGVPIVITNTGLLDLNGRTDDLGPLTMSGGDAASGTGLLELQGNLNIKAASRESVISGNLLFETANALVTIDDGPADYDLVISAAISDGGGGIRFVPGSGTGSFNRLTGTNTFTGPVSISGLTMDAESPFALGATNSPVTVTNGGRLFLYSTSITNKTVVLSSGTTMTAQNNCSWNGPIVLNGDATIAGFNGSSIFDLAGVISGAGNLTLSAVDTIRFSGVSTNTYVGNTTNLSGILALNKTGFNPSITGNLIVGGTTRLMRNEQINDNADVLVLPGGTFDFAAYYESINTLRGTGAVTFGSFGYLNIGGAGGTSTFDGLMSGTGYPGGYTIGKYGAGTFTTTANNTYSNEIDVFGGTMVVNGQQPQTPIYVAAGTTLSGNGKVADISNYGTISPGPSLGILSASNVLFGSSGQFTVELTGPNPGPGGYDQLNMNGVLNLGNATLGVASPLSHVTALGQQFVIISNNGPAAVTGTFNGLPEGTGINVAGYGFKITYTGGSGNDVALILTNVPATSSGSTVISGNGNHSIDPNECNSLYLVVSNKVGLPMNGVTATLSSTTTGVIVTQPSSGYPNIPGNGKGTNVTAFQFATLSSLPCGQDITLQLAVSSSAGAFSFPVLLHTGEALSPSRFDNSTLLPIPDVGTVTSTNTVSGISGPLGKVTVALYLTHVLDADLTLALISPDGTTNILTAGNGGGGANFGAGCSPDSSRTTFDDDAAVSITAGSAPFIGTFRPQAALATFYGKTGAAVNGNWRLQITDCCGGSLGTLRCWSLFLSPLGCAAGSGLCQTCPGTVSGSILNTDPAQTNRLNRNGVVSSCDSPKAFPGTIGGSFHYRAYAFTNSSPADACINVWLDSLCGTSIQATAYLGSFDPLNIAANYIGDIGLSPATAGSFSVTVPGLSQFIVVVNESTAGVGCAGYNLVVMGSPCPAPALAIASAQPQVTLQWPTFAGGYNLESTPALVPAAWALVTNEPIVIGGKYSVTNISAPGSRFYRLHKP